MFFKKKNTDSNLYSLLGADMHSHLLPGIDDGSADMKTSLMLIRSMKELGYRKLITTPHILWDMYKNTHEIILEKYAMVKEKLQQESIDIEFEVAAEYFIDDHVEQLLSQKTPLLTFGNKMLLVEFSMASPPLDLKEVLFEMQMQGYQPIIAHPERYTYFQHNKSFYEELKDAGFLFQLNILSLSGHYGSSVSDIAHYLVKQDYYDLIGTDLHHAKHLDALHSSSVQSSVKKLVNSERLLNSSL